MPELHPSEIVSILTKRIANLNRGSGDYGLAGRVQAIQAARRALDKAEREILLG